MWIKTEDRTPTIPDMPEDYVASQEFQVFVPGKGQMVAQFFKSGSHSDGGGWREKGTGDAIEPTHWTYLMRGPNEQEFVAEAGIGDIDFSDWTPRGLQRSLSDEFGRVVRAEREARGGIKMLREIYKQCNRLDLSIQGCLKNYSIVKKAKEGGRRIGDPMPDEPVIIRTEQVPVI